MGDEADDVFEIDLARIPSGRCAVRSRSSAGGVEFTGAWRGAGSGVAAAEREYMACALKRSWGGMSCVGGLSGDGGDVEIGEQSADLFFDVVADGAYRVEGLACTAMADWARERVGLAFIPPGQPWRNGYIESFKARVRDECLNINIFWSLTQARVVIADWKQEYNHHRPHSAVGYRTPASYAAACTHR